jgi:hypothetical protein
MNSENPDQAGRYCGRFFSLDIVWHSRPRLCIYLAIKVGALGSISTSFGEPNRDGGSSST